MRKTRAALCGLLFASLTSSALAQDSVSIVGGLPGDAVSPYADGAAAFGSEQCNNYVVDLTPFTSRSGTRFGIAPLIKSVKADPLFFNNLISAQGISRKQELCVAQNQLPAASYALWGGPGFGVNNNPALNAAPPQNVLPIGRSNQFAAGYSDFGGTYNGVTGAIVNVEATAPGRLYVARRQAANNGCMPGTNISQIGFGSVDEAGVTVFRADNFGAAAGCGVNPLTANNVYMTNMAARNCQIQNVINNDFPALFDTTNWIVQNSITAHNTPAILPTAVVSPPLYIGSNFLIQYVRGAAFPPTADGSHLAAGVTDHRGNLAYTCDDCSFVGSSAGLAGLIGYDAASNATIINVFGLNAAGGVTGTLGIPVPQTIIDNCSDPNNPRQNIEGLNEMDHYHSQVAFRGGNGQVALGADADGRLLAAVVVDHPQDGGPQFPLHHIMVARVDCANGSIDYTMAGYVWSASTATPATPDPIGKTIFDGSGVAIGQMTQLGNIPGAPTGPSVSAPMIDGAGNVWFISAIEMFGAPNFFTSGLLRAVYDPVNFCYTLELVFINRDVFAGMNSLRPWQISFLAIADSDSVNSGTAWSQNISDVPHMSNMAYLNGPASGQSPPTEADPRSLGGLVINAEITYDHDLNGQFDPLAGADQDYQVLLYIGALTQNADLDGDGDVDLTDFALFGACFGGSGMPPAPGCSPAVNADLDCDVDVDLTDFALFAQQFTGAL